MLVPLVLAAVAAAAQVPTASTACGPWVVGMTDNGFTVVWMSTERSIGWVETAPDDGTSFYAEERPRYYEDLLGRHVVSTLHSVRIEGLKPGTAYRYRIYQQGVDDSGAIPVLGRTTASNVYSREPYRVRTFDTAADKCRFTVVNDIHGRDSILRALTADATKREVDFVAFNGDMSSSVESGEQLFKDYLDASAALFAAGTPILFTRGNHETRGVFADSLGDYFPGRDGRFYGIYRYGDVCILLLDCGEDKPDDHAEYNGLADYDAYRAEECAWLKKAVRSEEFLTASARIVLLHIPPAAGAWHGSVHLNELFVPVLNEAGIDLMLCGHDHRYSFHPAGERDAKFPIVVNDNRSCVRCDVADSLIRVRIAGPRDKTVHTHEFPLKPQFQP